MLKQKLKEWLLKKLDLKMYTIEERIDKFTIITLNKAQYDRFIPIKTNQLIEKLAHKLPITFLEYESDESASIVLKACIYCMEIKDEKSKSKKIKKRI